MKTVFEKLPPADPRWLALMKMFGVAPDLSRLKRIVANDRTSPPLKPNPPRLPCTSERQCYEPYDFRDGTPYCRLCGRVRWSCLF
jgi:hypothetical protein